MVQRLVDAQMLSPADAARHPDANKILRALGTQADVDVELRPQPLRHIAGDLFVLCSDGLSDLVENEDILREAGKGSAAQAAGELVALANARGGHDNITAVVLRVRTPARTQPTKVAPTVVEGPPPADATASEPARVPGAGATVPLIAVVDPVRVEAGSSSHIPRRGARPGQLSARLVAGLSLAFVGLGIAVAAAYVLHRERSGREHPKGPDFDLSSFEAGTFPAASAFELVRPPLPSDEPDAADPLPLPPLAPVRAPQPSKASRSHAK